MRACSGREQKVLHVADHVLRLAADHDGVAAAAGERLGHGRGRIEALAVLVERGHGEVGAEPHAAGVGRERAGEEIDQRGLAAAVRADDADAVAALDADGEVGDDRPAVVGLADAVGLDHQRAGSVRGGGGERGLAGGRAVAAARLAAAPARRRAGGRCACAAR